MINNIILKGIATYRTGATLQTDKKVNLIYGLNGVGKSTLSKYLYNIQNVDYSQCSIEIQNSLEDYEFLVYNTKFVEDNFYEKNTQKGIFTLSKENKEIEEQINQIEKMIAEKISSQEEIQKKLAEIDSNYLQILTKTKNSIWDSKLKYFDNDATIQQIIGKGSGKNKDHYFNMVRNAVYDPQSMDINTIRTEYDALSKHKEKISLIPAFSTNFVDIEKNPLLQKQIVGSSNSSISDFIEMLKNTDWIKTGRSYLKILNNKICPFCQRDGLSETFVNELERYFDNTYEKDIKRLEEMHSSLTSTLDQLLDRKEYLRNFFSDYKFLAEEFSDLFSTHISNLKNLLESNIESLRQKLKEPSTAVVLKDSAYCLTQFNQLIEKLNQKIQEFNGKIDNANQEKSYLEGNYWKAVHKEYKTVLEAFDEAEKNWNIKKSHYSTVRHYINDFCEKQFIELKEKRKQVTNMDVAVTSINEKLNDVGLGHLKIVKYQENSDSEQLYRVVRNGEKETDFKSLSEGEKMMVTFLYFVERCKGASSTDNLGKKKIIVIDDPISSLSHIFVYNVALIINKEFNNWNRLNNKNENGAEGYPYPYDQVFILTHNLYFYYELAERDGARREKFQKLFRIQKKDNDSSIVELKYNEIHNDYQAYWTIIKNARESDHPLLANCMRNILEYFFVFTENRDLPAVFRKPELSSIDFQSFYRYINRESHSVGQNACDTKEFDYEQLLELFKRVFEVTHYETHFETMIKIK